MRNFKCVWDTIFNDYYIRLNTSPDFILCFAENLYTRNFYREAIPVLEQACRLRPSSVILCDLGLCYQKNKEYMRARNAFQLASCMTPAYILPRYYLFSLYVETGQRESAGEVARYALFMPVKVINSSVLRVRSRMRAYLNLKESNVLQEKCNHKIRKEV